MKKLKELQEKHQIEKHKFVTDEFDQKQRDNALLILGGIHVADKIAASISSQVMRALITFQDQQMYLSFGHENFVDFLENNDYAPMTKNQFYQRKQVFEVEGEKLFDLMNEVGVSMATRKLLAAGNYEAITIENDVLKIGGETADLSNARLVRTLIESYADDCKRLKTESEKKTEKISKLQSQVETGANQYQKLQRAIDAASGGHPHDIAFMRLLSAFVNLKNEAVNLSDEEKANFAPNIFAEIAAKLDSLSVAYNRVSKSTTNNADYSEPDDGTTDWQTREHRRRLKKVQSDENKNAEIAEVNDDELADLMD